MLFYVRSFSYTPFAVLCGEFLLHAPCCFMWGVSVTHPLLFYRGSFSYTPLAGACGEFYTARAVLCGEFLLHAPFCFKLGVTLTHLMLFYVWRGSCRLLTFVTRRLTNQWKNKVCWVKSVYHASDQASVVIKMTWQMNLTGRANPSLIGTACVTLWRRYWHLPLTDFVLRLLSVLFYAVSVLPTLCYLMWGICPTHPGLFMWKMCLTPHSILCAEYVLHTLCYFMWGVSILCGEFRKRPMLF